MFGPVVQPLLHCDAQLLQDGETERGLAHVGLLVEVVGSLRDDDQTIRTPRALHRVLEEGREQQLTACQLLVQFSV